MSNRVGSHYFREEGDMVLKFSGSDWDDIKKMGRWSLDTFLIYIHNQIAEYSKGWTKNSKRMILFKPGGRISVGH